MYCKRTFPEFVAKIRIQRQRSSADIYRSCEQNCNRPAAFKNATVRERPVAAIALRKAAIRGLRRPAKGGHTRRPRKTRPVLNVAEGVIPFRVVRFSLRLRLGQARFGCGEHGSEAGMIADEIKIRICLRPIHGLDAQLFERRFQQVQRGLIVV